MEIWYLAGAGLLAGVISGMGIGGGVVLVPVLTLLIGLEQKTAQGINLLYFIPTALMALWVHRKSKLIEWSIVWRMAVPGAISAAAGAIAVAVCPAALLRRVFAGLLLLIAGYEFYLAFWKKGE